MFLDDPSDLLSPLEAVWPGYFDRADALVRSAEERVVEWRFTEEQYYLPDHPFYRTIDTAMEELNDYWTPRAIRWIENVEHVSYPVRHGFDEQRRLVLIRQGAHSRLIIFGDGFYDLLRVFRDKGAEKHRMGDALHRDGVRRGSFMRFLVDDEGRITTKIRLNDEGVEPDSHYRKIELFHWEGRRLTESFRQGFTRGHNIPAWAKDYSQKEQAELYRGVNDELREFMSSRERIDYEYAADGRLIKAERIHVVTGFKNTTLYSYNPSDTIEKVSAEMAGALIKAIVKLLKGMKNIRPIRRVALVYSAEHVHCGLPTGVLISGAGDECSDPLDWEAYPHEAAWPLEGRAGQKIDSLHRRLQIVVEGSDEYAEDIAPRPYRMVLWQVSRAVYHALSKKKRIVSEDFTVFPIDDHGDADPIEDVRESLPSDVAKRVMRELQN